MPIEIKTAFLIALLFSTGLVGPASAALQRYEINHALSELQMPQGPESFFFAVIQNEKAPDGMSPSFLQGYLPSLTSDPNAKENYFFIRDGSALIIIPQTVLENGSSSSPSVPFAPLLLVWLDSERRRSRFRIYVEILEALRRGPMTPFEVSFYLRLNSKRTRECVEFLIKKGFLESTTIDGKTVCAVTESGKVLADSMKTILDKE